MPVAANDIVSVTVDGRKDSQTILNVFHYRCTAAPSSGSVSDNITALMNTMWDDPAGTWLTAWRNVMPNDYTLRASRGQRVAPTRSAYIEKLIQTDGLIVEDPIQTANMTWVFVKQSEVAGRWAQSPTHMLLPANSWYTNGELNNGAAPERAVLLALVPSNVIPGDGSTWEPVIFNPGRVPNFVRITHVTERQEVRVMRRRTVRVGI